MGIPALGSKRPLVVQGFRTFTFTAGVKALPIEPNLDKTKLITGFVISNPVGAISVFLGNIGVTIASGLEIQAGTAPFFGIDQGGRQLYEVQSPLLDISSGLKCSSDPLGGIPFVVWDLSTVFLVAAAPQIVTVAVFPTMYL